MASRVNVAHLAFNRGVISTLALARADIERIALSAEQQTNWMPRSLGSMMLRAGLQYLLPTRDNSAAVYIPFIFSSSDTALLEITSGAIRVIKNDTVVTRAAVSSSISNGGFTSNLTGWTDNDESGATSAWATGGYLSLTGTGATAARRTQAVSIAGGDQNKLHGINLVVHHGVVSVRVGSTSGGIECLSASNLGPGNHRITFTPTGGTVYVDLSSITTYSSAIDSISIDSAGDLVLSSPWTGSDIQNIRYSQSGDIVYVACRGKPQYKIERRSNDSWSIVSYLPIDGPFRNANPDPITLTPSALSGNITVTASSAVFKPGHVGALFSLDSVGQQVTETLVAESQYSEPIRVTGVEANRNFTVAVSGTWSGTVTLQRSISAPGAWIDVQTYTSNGTGAFADGLDNQIIYYRIGIKPGAYGSGSAVASLIYQGGSITGAFRITAVSGTTTASASVVKDLGGTTANDIWSEGSWSAERGYPSAVALYEGRLWWAGKGGIYGSISDSYESFDEEEEGDAGPLNRTIGYGPVDNINWLLPVNRLILGTDGAEVSARSTSFDEPLTPTNFNLKNASTQGSAAVAAVTIDTKGVYVQKSGARVYELAYNSQDFDYASSELTVLCPEIGQPSIVRMAVQRQPDTRIHCIRSDGKVAVQVYDRAENVLCWVLVETDGEVEEAVVVPGTIEDSVYYVVRRGSNRYLEKWALESECQGGALNKQADSFVVYEGVATSTIAGLDHLEGDTVVVWADGLDAGTKTVSGGAITLDDAATKAVVGLGYTAMFRSTKLAYGAQMGTALGQRKRIDKLALILQNTHIGGITFGRDFEHLDPISREVAGEIVSADTILQSYDADAQPFNGKYTTDERLCLRAAAPRPVTLLAAVLSLEVNEKV